MNVNLPELETLIRVYEKALKDMKLVPSRVQQRVIDNAESGLVLFIKGNLFWDAVVTLNGMGYTLNETTSGIMRHFQVINLTSKE